MPVKRYEVVNGQVLSEKSTGGQRIDYLPDALGSVVCTALPDQSVSQKMRYAGYGKRVTPTVPTPKRTWVGTHGYAQTGLTWADVSLPFRHYSTRSTRWATVDPIWPFDSAYRYVESNPIVRIDPLGKWPTYFGCSRDVINKINGLCLNLYFMSNQDRYLINRCIAAAAKNKSINCQGITENRKSCLAKWCDEDGMLTCGPIPSPPGFVTFGLCPGTPPWDTDRIDPSDRLSLNLVPPYVATYATWLSGAGGQVTFLHELMHACGQLHNSADLMRQCNDIQACCLFEVLANRNDGHRCVNLI